MPKTFIHDWCVLVSKARPFRTSETPQTTPNPRPSFKTLQKSAF